MHKKNTENIQGFDMPVSIAFTGDGKSAYVANQRAATVSVIDTKSGTITKTISVAGNPIYIYIDK